MKKVIEISPLNRVSKKRKKEFFKARDKFMREFSDVSYILSQSMRYEFNHKLLKKPLTDKDIWIYISNRVKKVKDTKEK